MPNWHILSVIGALGLVSYAMRSSGFLVAGLIPEDGMVARFFRLAPGNLFIAFVAAACLEGGWPRVAGCVAVLAVMVVTRKEWAALAAGFVVAAFVASSGFQ